MHILTKVPRGGVLRSQRLQREKINHTCRTEWPARYDVRAAMMSTRRGRNPHTLFRFPEARPLPSASFEVSGDFQQSRPRTAVETGPAYRHAGLWDCMVRGRHFARYVPPHPIRSTDDIDKPRLLRLMDRRRVDPTARCQIR